MSDVKARGFRRPRPCYIHSKIEALIDRAVAEMHSQNTCRVESRYRPIEISKLGEDTEAEKASVGLGEHSKIITLCQTYYRLGSDLWTSEGSISDHLLNGLQ